MTTRLGEFLKQRRNAIGLTQKQLADKLSAHLPRAVSQGLIAQLETGRIALPDGDTLKSLARLCGQDYEEFVFRVALDVVNKYISESELSGLGRERLELWEASLKHFPTVGTIPGLEEDQLRSKAVFIKHYEMLDFEGIIKWQTNFPNLRDLWVVVLDFLDDRNPDVQKATIKHLKDGVRIYYFVPEGAEQVGEKFWTFKHSLSGLGEDIKPEMVEAQVLGFPLTRDQQRFVTSNLIIANPLQLNESVGFRILQQDSGQPYAIRLTSRELGQAVVLMRSWVIQQLDEQHKADVLQFRHPASKVMQRRKQ